jgi:hypothetical protein
MPSFVGRMRLLVPVCVVFLGCRSESSGPAIITTEIASTEPGEILLSDPQVTMTEPNRVQFEVHYRFTKGKPDKYYMCEVLFPGTLNHASKPMERHQLQAEGVIRDGFRLPQPPVDTFEIRVSEADSPQNGYKLISNVAAGKVGGK